MGSHSFLQGILPTLGWNLGLLHCRQILYHLSHQGSPNYPTEVAKNKPDKGSEVPDPPTTAREQRTGGYWAGASLLPTPLPRGVSSLRLICALTTLHDGYIWDQVFPTPSPVSCKVPGTQSAH